MKSYFWLSCMLHFVLVLFLTVNFAYGKKNELPFDDSVIVDFLTVGKISKAPNIGPKTYIADKTPKNEEVVSSPDPKQEKAIQTPKEDKPKEEPKIEDPVDEPKKEEETVKEEIKEDPKPEPKQEKPKNDEVITSAKEKPKKQKEKKEPKKKSVGTKDKGTTSQGEKGTKKGPKKLGPENQGVSQYNAQQIGDVLTASEASIIRHKLNDLWNPPMTVRGIPLKIKVKLKLNELGEIIDYKIMPYDGSYDENLYNLTVSSIEKIFANPECHFRELSEETRKILSKTGLEPEFDPAEI